MDDSIRVLKGHPKSIKTVIFDMDGVLIDSEEHHFIAHKEALSEFGTKINKSFYIAHGISTDPALFYAKAFKEELLSNEVVEKILRRKMEIYEKLQKLEGIAAIAPAIDLVHLLNERKINTAICSAVNRREVERNLHLLKLDGFFKVMVAGGDFPIRNKPFPDIYLKTAKIMGISPEHCIVIEDSASGAEAAIRAGMVCIVIPNDYTKSQDFPESAVISSFDEVSRIIVNL